MIRSVNPATGAKGAPVEPHDTAQINRRLDDAVAAQQTWKWLPVERRVDVLRQLARELRAEEETLAATITGEMGKPIAEARAEIHKCADTCDYYATSAPAILAESAVPDVPGASVIYEPLGVVLAIMPWNYPVWQVVRFLAPALAAGNGAILKHAANVPQCAAAVEDIVKRAGAPDGLFANLYIEPAQVSALVADSRIAAVTLTGSTEVGMIVAGQAGAALKKQVLELGGSDPFVVLSDADVDHAATMATAARFTNAGQSCVNAKRFIVVEEIADRFVEAFSAACAQRLVMGDPCDETTTLGPLARENLRDALASQVERTVAAGASLVRGGKIVDGRGYFYEPTVLDRVEPGMAAFDEETFGPAAAVVRAADEDTAVALANRTAFGLGASIWTVDTDRGAELAREIEAGCVFVNAVVASDPRVPFGGIKHSGYGRELGDLGIKEFTNAKTIRIANV